MVAYEENDGGRLPLTWAQTKRMPMTQLVSLPVTCTPPLPALQCTRLCRHRRGVAPRALPFGTLLLLTPAANSFQH